VASRTTAAAAFGRREKTFSRLRLPVLTAAEQFIYKPNLVQDFTEAPYETLVMKYFIALLFSIAVASSTAQAVEAPPAAQSIHLTNGATATSYDHCGDMDLCAKIIYDNGNVLSIYSEGAAYCQPYLLHFVYADANKTLFEFSRALNHTHAKDAGCGKTMTTEMVFDRGYVHMLVTENGDGTLNTAFSVAKL
jgi:hypothetical protein